MLKEAYEHPVSDDETDDTAPSGPPVDGSLLIGLLTLYPMLRFAAGGLSLVPLALTMLLFALAVLRAPNLKLVVLWSPLLLGTIAGWAYCWFNGLDSEATYFMFLTLLLGIIASLSNTGFTYSHRAVLWIGAFFCATVLMFLVIPGLADLASQHYATAVAEAAGEDYITVNDDDKLREADRFHAYFIHSNEFGIFAAAFFFILVLLRDGEASFAAKLASLVIAGTLAIFVASSGSATAKFVLVASLALRIMPAAPVLIGLCGLFCFQFLSQVFFPDRVLPYLESGSFYWRYLSAQQIVNQAPFFAFDPGHISLVGTWPHSIFLDFTFLFGLAGAGIVTCLAVVFALFAVPPVTGGAVLVFFICAALQPAGAMPSCFLLLAVAIILQASVNPDEALSQSTAHDDVLAPQHEH